MAFKLLTTTTGKQEGCDEINGRFDPTVGHSHEEAYGGKPIGTNGIQPKAITADRLSDTAIVDKLGYTPVNPADITVDVATQAEAQAGTDNTKVITPLQLRNGLNASGLAPISACRAWVDFNGTGTVTIREGLNISSIADNGVGDYTINFTQALPSANYSVLFGGQIDQAGGAGYSCISIYRSPTAKTVNSLRINTTGISGGNTVNVDYTTVCVGIII